MYDRTILAALELMFILKFRPTFLTLQMLPTDDIIEVVISCKSFDYQDLSERTISVFNEIWKQFPNLIDEHLIVVQCFSTSEMEKVLDDIFNKESQNE